MSDKPRVMIDGREIPAEDVFVTERRGVRVLVVWDFTSDQIKIRRPAVAGSPTAISLGRRPRLERVR